MSRGFTLIEMLVVLTLIGLLMGLVAVGVAKYAESGRIADAQARIQAVSILVASYADRHGDVPQSQLLALKVADHNGLNEGVEALVAALRSSQYGGGRPDERWLGNVDGDSARGLDSFDGSTALLELVDPWDRPFVYISHEDYARDALYRLDEGEDQSLRAATSPLTGTWFHPDGFQLRSAGPDGLLGSDDDLANHIIDGD